MIIKKDEVRNMCKLVAPKYGFDWRLIYAVCLQECDKEKDGSFDPSVARVEQRYYRKYTEVFDLATTTEVLLATSYGVMQMMGQSLNEAGYFKWFFYSQSQRTQNHYGNPLSEISIVKAINKYCVNLEWMIRWGCKWMAVKREKAKNNERLMLTYWNGSSAYPDEIYKRLETIKAET